MEESRRQKRLSSLLKEELSRLMLESLQDSTSGLITVTRVLLSRDLRSARVFLSILGSASEKEALDQIRSRKGYLRKTIASRLKLKYNPELHFALDERFKEESRIEEILKKLEEDEP